MHMDIFKKFKSLLMSLSLSTLILYLINKSFQYFALVKHKLTNQSGKYYNWKFGKIYYQKQGTGTPLLLIHDLTIYSSSYEWKNIIKELSENHTVYCLDLLGCGRSEKPAITYTNYLYVQLITDFIKNVIGIKPDVIASNTSSSIAIMALQNDKNLFNKVIIINPPKIQKKTTLTIVQSKIFRTLLSIPIFGTFVFNIITSKPFLKNEFKEYYFYNQKKYSDKTIQIYYESSQLGEKSSKYLYASIIGNYTYSNIKTAIQQINHKIIIISTKQSKDFNNIIHNYCIINPYIEFEIIENAKMLPHFEVPDIFIEVVNKYI